MPYKPTWKERREDLKPYVGPIIAGVLVLAVGGWWVWRTVIAEKPGKRLAVAVKDAPARSANVQRAVDDVAALEQAYQRALETGAPAEAVAAALDRAIEKQRELILLQPRATLEQTEKLARWEAARDGQRWRAAQTRSLELETEASTARQAGQGDAALEKMREALRLQREANANAGGVGRRDLPREKRLAEEIQAAEAAPGREAVTAALTQARAAVAQEKWGEALKAYTEAHKAQTELNQRFLGTRHADIPGLARIEQELQSLRAAGLAASVTTRIQEADEAARTSHPQEAAAGYVAAMAALRELKEKFPQSHFASDPRGDDLEVRRQTVLSEALLTQAVAIDREVREGLRRRQTGAASRLAAAARLVETVAADYPRSRLLDPLLQKRLSYLALKAGELDALQDQVVTRLAPLPGAEARRLLTTEMPQDLYQRVMNGNPSRQTGRGLPVDSVSWQDARECCERLSWLLGRRVRLPTEAEFRAVWTAGGKGAWSADNSAGRSRETGKSPATPAGFYDLAGNLAEWLQTKSEEGETAPVAGGSYLDPATALATLKIETVDRRERAPHIGFRVVVE